MSRLWYGEGEISCNHSFSYPIHIGGKIKQLMGEDKGKIEEKCYEWV